MTTPLSDERKYLYESLSAECLCDILALRDIQQRVLLDEVDRLRARVALLEGVLRSMQWSATSKLRDVCPSCGAWEPNGHFPDCELAAALGEATDAE